MTDTNASDYTIYVSNIPYTFDAEDYDDEIKRFFEVSVSRIAYKVNNIKYISFIILFYI